jgi:hypothetical protein
MRLRNRAITPDNSPNPHCDTLARTRFYDAYDIKDSMGRVPARKLFKQMGVSKTTAYRWLHDRNQYRSIAYRRSDLRAKKQRETQSQGSGRRPIVPTTRLHDMLNSSNASRQNPLYTQMQDTGITASVRTVQRALRTRCNACKFKAATMKEITPAQQAHRVEYTRQRQFYNVEGYWDGVIYTDEAHMSLNDYPEAWILRVFGERHMAQNLAKKADKTAACVHFAAWVNYYTKADELTFYNDEYDDYVAPTPPPRPRRRPATEDEDGYKQRIARWEAEKARIPEVIRPGNSMRASYYVDKILPVYRDALYQLRARADDLRGHIPREQRYNWYLVEDNDPSHGTRNSESLPAIYRRENSVERLPHPPNSPDLNPIEGIWLIIKERVRQRLHEINTIQELKNALQEEWQKVSINDIQERIIEMQYRCGEVFRNPGVRVKTRRW